MRIGGILALLMAYILLIATFGQFCESKAVKKTSILYKFYRFMLLPITLPFKPCGIDVPAKIQKQMWAMNNGRTYFVTVFYYILYFGSLFFVYATLVAPITIIFPRVNEEQARLEWIQYPTKQAAINFVPSFIVLITMLCHVSSLISFTTATLRDPNGEKNKDEFDEILYSALTCEDCKIERPARCSHCEQCNKCVNKRDHHCIWINQCVGRRNLFWFNVFLNSTAWACFFAGVINIATIIKIFTSSPSAEMNMFMLYQKKVFKLKIVLQWAITSMPLQFASGLMHLLISLMLIPFGTVHIFQALQNQTTLEKTKKYYLKEGLKRLEWSFFKVEGVDKKEFNKLMKEKKAFLVQKYQAKLEKVQYEDQIYQVLELKKALKEIDRYNWYSKGAFSNLIEVIKDGFTK
ncbi:DHHC_palmitoyltransferase [Hexamita inflata]|uniref:Palmitoyltransferase n=1 Tax=Hexamita inflata TaxID=28002 RepID=A0AA86RMD1_9EUKA|nr:DHHC palmitoyltransferase [Hexamita inflata]